MSRFLIYLLIFNIVISCSKKNEVINPPFVIPDIINGVITELNVVPIDITTPDKGFFLIAANNTIFNVDFNAVEQSQSNAELLFASDTLLINESREFANLGKDVIAYNPLRDNQIKIHFKDGKEVIGAFNINTSFGGVFGEQLIAQWRDSSDPAKPNQKAKDDITNFIKRYSDKDGSGLGTAPIYLFVQVSKH